MLEAMWNQDADVITCAHKFAWDFLKILAITMMPCYARWNTANSTYLTAQDEVKLENRIGGKLLEILLSNIACIIWPYKKPETTSDKVFLCLSFGWLLVLVFCVILSLANDLGNTVSSSQTMLYGRAYKKPKMISDKVFS